MTLPAPLSLLQANAGGGAEEASSSDAAGSGAAGADVASAAAVAAGAALSTPLAGASRRKSTKTVHPELLKFKLEKQAK